MSRIFQTPAWLKSNAIPRAVPVPDTDPKLAFMLAQQSISLWRLDAERLGDAVDMGSEDPAITMEATAALQRVGALRDRIGPFANYIDIAIRFEAQEVLAALEQLGSAFERVVRRMQPAPWRDPVKLAAELQARRQAA
jgi:hypothetical protein